MDSSYNERNNTETTRMRNIVERLSDDDLSREVRDGWTVAAMLAHLAMLDRLRLEGWELQARSPEHQRWFATENEQNLVNEASKPLLLAIPPREAARLAVEAAEAVDRKIASLSTDLVRSYQSANAEYETRMLDRSIHRRSHLNEIEATLSGS